MIPSNTDAISPSSLNRRAGARWELILVLVVLVGGFSVEKSRARRVIAQPEVISVPRVLRGEVHVAFVPEYERTMNRVVLAVERNGMAEDMAAKAGILQALPGYTEVLLLQDEVLGKRNSTDRLAGGQDAFRGLNLRETTVRWFDPESATAWAQDLGEGLDSFMFLGAKGRQHEVALNRLGVRAVPHFLPLDGGNVSLARNRSGERIVFIGEREFENARAAIVGKGYAASDARVLDAYRLTFNADRTVVLPTVGPDHIDQTVLFVGDGRAVTERVPILSAEDRSLLDEFLTVMARIPDDGALEYVDAFDSNYRGTTRFADTDTVAGERKTRSTNPRLLMPSGVAAAFLDFRKRVPHLQDLLYTHEFEALRMETERRLTENGFEVMNIETSINARLNKQYYVNAMVYRDRETGQATILAPVYPEPGDDKTHLDINRLSPANQRVVSRLEALGFAVKPVPGQYLRGGSTHCSLYQL